MKICGHIHASKIKRSMWKNKHLLTNNFKMRYLADMTYLTGHFSKASLRWDKKHNNNQCAIIWPRLSRITQQSDTAIVCTVHSTQCCTWYCTVLYCTSIGPPYGVIHLLINRKTLVFCRTNIFWEKQPRTRIWGSELIWKRHSKFVAPKKHVINTDVAARQANITCFYWQKQEQERTQITLERSLKVYIYLSLLCEKIISVLALPYSILYIVQMYISICIFGI